MVSARFVKFVVAGGLAAVANFGSRILLSSVMPYVPAIVIAYCFGMTVAFLLNRLFVFGDAANRVQEQAVWFVLVNVMAVLQTVAISLLFARWIFPAMDMSFHAETIAHAIGVIVPVFTSYVGHKRLTFRAGP
jgi:putative flippase GtrA